MTYAALEEQRQREVVDARLIEQSPFIVYDEVGNITGWGGSMAIGTIQALRIQGHRMLPEAGKPDVHWVDLSRGVPRKRVKGTCPAALDGLTLTNLPLPCRIEISGPAAPSRLYDETESTTLVLSFSHPGTYRVRVLSAPHTPGEWEVVVP